MARFYYGQTDYIQQLNYLDNLATLAKGDPGGLGPANTLSIGSVTYGAAAATITGAAPAQTLNLVLPATTLTIGSVTSGTAAASVTGTAPNQTLNLTLPTATPNSLAIGTVTSGATPAATITGAAPSQTLNLTLPLGLNWRNAWVSGTTYAVNDAVTNAGSSYYRKVAGAGSTVPGSDGTNWGVIAAAGTGAVSTVNSIAPTAGNVTLAANDVGASQQANFAGYNSSSVKAEYINLRTVTNPAAGLGYATGMRVRFACANDVDSTQAYADVLDLSTYTDNTGGGISSLYFNKGSQFIVHKWAAAGATSWTAKTLAYTDSNITGNAATATKLATPRTINGVNFDGSAPITITDGTKAPLASPAFTGNINTTQPGGTQASLQLNAGTMYGSMYFRDTDKNLGLYAFDGTVGQTRLRIVGPTGNMNLLESGTGNVTVGTATDDGSSGKLQVAGAISVTGGALLGANQQYSGRSSAVVLNYSGEGTQHGLTFKPAASTTTGNIFNFLSSSSTYAAPTLMCSMQHMTGNAGINLTGNWNLGGSPLVSTGSQDASGGYAGLTAYKINFKNAANTFTSFLTNTNTAARTYTFPDKSDTVAMLSDIPTAGSMVLLQSTTVSGTPATINFLTTFTSAYDTYVIEVTGVRPASNGSGLGLRVAVAGSAQSGSIYYNPPNVANDGSLLVSANYAQVGISAVSSKGATFTLKLRNANGADSKSLSVGGAQETSAATNDCYQVDQECLVLTSSVLSGFQLLWTGGINFTAGTVRVYGIKNS